MSDKKGKDDLQKYGPVGPRPAKDGQISILRQQRVTSDLPPPPPPPKSKGK